ncbi:MAG: AMP-binding protein [Anaerolineales bacterium]
MSDEFDFGGNIVWRPGADQIANARLTEFMQLHQLNTFDELMERSTIDVPWFSDAVLRFLDIQFYQPYSQVVDFSNGIAWPKWCVDGKMNIIHNCLDKYIGTEKEKQPAFIWEGEEGRSKTITYKALHQLVNQTANQLRALGLGKGDAIGVYMPMVPEIVAAVLAIAKIGGVILPLFSGYGASAVATRLNDADAKALFTADGFYRRGKPIAMKPTADAAANMVPTLTHMIVFDRTGQAVEMQPERDFWWHESIPHGLDDWNLDGFW